MSSHSPTKSFLNSSKLMSSLAVGFLSLASLSAFVWIKARKRRGGRAIMEPHESLNNPDSSSQLSAHDTADTWIGNPARHASTKMDLLHRGHNKGGKLLVVMVGLPGAYKTLIARKVARFLRWNSYNTRAFSIAKYRLDKLGSKSADFFVCNMFYCLLLRRNYTITKLHLTSILLFFLLYMYMILGPRQ